MRYLLIWLLLWPCFVNSQTYTGSLQSMRSPYLTINSQDVNLNIDQVKVSYTYYNAANFDITETLVFMLPLNGEDQFKQFSVVVNQEPVHHQTIQHAISANGRDITKELKNLGLPVNPISAMHAIDASSNRDSIISKLRALHLIDRREDTPTWTVKTYYYWDQTFPANSKVVIDQSYKPSLQTQSVKLSSFAALFKLPLQAVKKIVNVAIHWTLEDEVAQNNLQEQFEKNWPQIQNFCPNKQDYQTLVNAYKVRTNKKSQIELKELHFANGNNELWAHPINRFNLTIESPKNMHAILCWNDEMKRSSNNTLHFTADNYIPLQQIAVLYIEK